MLDEDEESILDHKITETENESNEMNCRITDIEEKV